MATSEGAASSLEASSLAHRPLKMQMKIQPFLGHFQRRFQRRVLPEGDIGHFLAWWFGIHRSAVSGSFFLFFQLLLSQKAKIEKKKKVASGTGLGAAGMALVWRPASVWQCLSSMECGVFAWLVSMSHSGWQEFLRIVSMSQSDR